ncbi:acyl-CoA dehydrogenase family protein [Streptomyces lavendulae]|uniref:acyl-CoA dehydrogenase family protein n=1 Tax=Streptomyces lavendulae TaxID=1914 RepID=UPI0033E6B139
MAEAVAESLTAALAELLPAPPPAARTCTALRHAITDGLLGTRCDISLRSTPNGWTATGRAEHVLGLPDAEWMLCEAAPDWEGNTALVLLPLDSRGLTRNEHQPSALDGARFGDVRLNRVTVPDAHVVQVQPGLVRMLRGAVAGTRLRLARLATELAAEAVEAAVGHVAQRPFAGGRLADRQVVRHTLVEATAQVRMCDAYLEQAERSARTAEKHHGPGAGQGVPEPAQCLRDAALRVAAYVAFAAPQAVEAACQLHGGYGFLEEEWIARAYRHSVFTSILLGGQEQRARAACLPVPAAPETAACRTRIPVLPTDSLTAFRAGARALVRHDIAPRVPDWEANGGVTRDLFTVAGSAGVFGVRVPTREGGLGLGLRHGVAFIRAVGRDAVGGVSTSLSVQTHVAVPLLLKHGTQQQKQRWLRPLLTGGTIAAVAITEPAGGSDLVNATATKAVRTEEGWMLEGEKTFVTNAPIADVLIVLARTEPQGGALGMTFFLVPTDLPEVRVRQLQTMGLRSSRTGRIRFTGCRLPDDAVLGRRGMAMAHLAQVLPEERLAISAGMLECARRCVERTATLPAVRASAAASTELAGWNVRLEAAEAFLDAAVERFDGGGDDRLDADLAKTVSARLTQQIVNGCARLTGPEAFFDAGEESSLLPDLRDVRVLSVFGGSCETVKDTAAAEILRGAVVRRSPGRQPCSLPPAPPTALRRDHAEFQR